MLEKPECLENICCPLTLIDGAEALKGSGRHQSMFLCSWKCSRREGTMTRAVTDEVRRSEIQVEGLDFDAAMILNLMSLKKCEFGY